MAKERVTASIPTAAEFIEFARKTNAINILRICEKAHVDRAI